MKPLSAREKMDARLRYLHWHARWKLRVILFTWAGKCPVCGLRKPEHKMDCSRR